MSHLQAYMRGLERRVAAGLSPDVRSVASVFLSRWDGATIEKVSDRLRDKLGIAIGQQVYKTYRDILASDRWQRLSNFGARPQRLLFASTGTKDPKAPDVLYIGAVLQKVIRPAALRAGIRKKIGWHTFRHTYSTLLIANGENVKVVQELMRHASSRFTLEIYSQGQIIAKRQGTATPGSSTFPRGSRAIAACDSRLLGIDLSPIDSIAYNISGASWSNGILTTSP